MGLLYKACNEEIDRAYQEALVAPAGQMLMVPWLSGSGLLAAGRLGLIAAHDAGVGLAKSGRNYKFYYSRTFAGWWGFEAWGLLKTAIFGLLWLMVLGTVVREYAQPAYNPGMALNGLVPYKMFLLGLLGLAAFGVRGLFCFRHAKISLASGSTVSMTPACINFAILVLSIAAVHKGYITMGVDRLDDASKIGWHAVSHGSLWGALIASPIDFLVGVKHVITDDADNLTSWVFFLMLPVAFSAGAWVIMRAGFWPMAAKVMFRELNAAYGNTPVVPDVYNDSDFAKVVDLEGPGSLLMVVTYSVVLFVVAKMIAF